MAEWGAIYEKGKAYEINFCSAKYEEAKAVEKVCDAIMDKKVSTPDDVQIVRHGKWILLGGNFRDKDIVYYECSECGRQEWNQEPYCHCGAKMED
jgi:hypothetical protein